ncbi:MAG: glycoside hydrolase family 9 protein [Saprospiraceae bacterium]
MKHPRTFLTAALLFAAATLFAQQLGTTDNHIKVDQFGYPPFAQKIGIVSNPQVGYNNNQPFTNPSATYEVRRWADNSVAFSGPLVAWNGGATHAQSGDKVWHFDFSALTETGSFYLYDPVKLKRSYRFDISNTIYNGVLKQAVRSFYYQRCGTAKSAPHAQSPWTDGVCHTHAQQDVDCRLVSNPVAGTAKNLRGGWHDAGDYNKYTNFTFGTLTDMLLAYEENPAAWADDYGIPESGNGVPDLLDEIKYELDWLRRMQLTNGALLSKVSVTDFGAASPPSADNNFRRYGAESTSSTLTGAAIFALAALQYKQIPARVAYADTLKKAAEKAWTWANNNPAVIFSNAGFSSANPEVSDYDRLARKVCAAAYLFALTNKGTYKTFFDANYQQMHLMQWSFAYPFETHYQDGMLYYTRIANSTAAVRAAIQNTYATNLATGNADNLPAFLNKTDAYRAFLSDNNTVWGSNTFRSEQGSMFHSMNSVGLDEGNHANYRNAGYGITTWLHGTNPTAYCMLSNMGTHGAEFSIPEFYHSWFGDGTPLDQNPAPGFMPGGPNKYFAPDPACGCTIAPPQNQPTQKSFKAWNTSWPQNSWEITENAIYTNAAYIRLLSKMVGTDGNNYCRTRGLDNSKEWIDRVAFSTVDRTSGADASGYVSTGLTGTLVKGAAATVTYSAGFPGVAKAEKWYCYIDYNQNGVFEATERAFTASRNGLGDFSNTFTVPNTALTGPTRLRMVMSRTAWTNPCGLFRTGEVEDYLVNITPAADASDDRAAQIPPRIRVFPNPAGAVLNFETDGEQVRSAAIFDFSGKKLSENLPVNSPAGSLPTGHLATGIYLLVLDMEDGRQEKLRFVRQ